MLIELDRDVIKGQLKHGWSHGLYWRAVRTYTLNHKDRLQTGVYIQVLVPYSRHSIGLMRLCDAGGLPALHNADIGSCGDLHRVQEFFGGFRSEMSMQWYETIYGTQYMEPITCDVIETTLQREWNPHKKMAANGYLLPRLFLEHIQPTAEHVCLHISRALVWPTSSESLEPAPVQSDS